MMKELKTGVGEKMQYIFYILVFELSINFLVFFPILYILNIVDPIISETRIDYKENQPLSNTYNNTNDEDDSDFEIYPIG